MTAVAEQLDLLDLAEECPHCGHESDMHYRPSAGTKGCRVFTCGCPGWVSTWMRTQIQAERDAWAARFERAPWSRPYDTGHGPAGTVVDGWVCPACGKVEDNTCSLDREHGYDPDVPGQWPGRWRPGNQFGDVCTRQILLASQERARAAREASS